MNREEAFEFYYQGCKDIDSMIDESSARIYFDLYWDRRRVHRPILQSEHDQFINEVA